MGLYRSLLIGLLPLLVGTGVYAASVGQDDQGAVSGQLKNQYFDAARRGDVENQRNGAGQTAAIHAALFERTELLQALEDRGADMEAEDAFGNSPVRLLSGEIHTAPPDRPDRSR